MKDAVASLIDVRRLRWISFSHFEADECGSLPDWQQVAPQSDAVCSLVGKVVSVDDCLALPSGEGDGGREVLHTGRYGFNFWRRRTCRIAGSRVSYSKIPIGLCSAQICFTRRDNGEPTTQSDVVGRCREVLKEYQQGPLANYMPYCTLTEPTLTRLAALKPNTLATMHGSVFLSAMGAALRDLTQVFREVLGGGRHCDRSLSMKSCSGHLIRFSCVAMSRLGR